MARWHLGRDNWFLVIPAAILGLVALFTVNRLYRAGDIRRAIEVVTTYQAEGREPLGQALAGPDGNLSCRAEVRSSFYGTLDVTCRAPDGHRYRWRVLVGQRAFAPADEATRAWMMQYDPEMFARGDEGADAVR